jgi:UDP-N-acetylglucosamine--N-acetylmuramyl-(pentapeptide) pyrophosphoryl-undecaprenol N-acetylglucosamine transferase
LAIVAALSEKPDVLWVGGEGGMESSLVRRAGLPFEAIPAAGIHGVGLRQLPQNLWKLARGAAASRRVLKRYRPEVLLFTGGYVGVPVALAGRNTPKLAYVPDLEPGLALQWICRMADTVAVTAPESRRHYPSTKRVVVAGYPTRAELSVVDVREARKRLGLTSDLPVLLVYGGSRGARSLNHALWNHLPSVLVMAQVIHVTGDLDWPEVAHRREGLPIHLAGRYHPYAYLHEEMGLAMSASDLAVSRAGASTLGEFPLFGLPAILVPYPYAWRYQHQNAEYLVSRGAAVQVKDENLETELLPLLSSLLSGRQHLRAMREAMRGLARPEAARTIAGELEALAQQRGEGRD